jgi:hypothetical protein
VGFSRWRCGYQRQIFAADGSAGIANKRTRFGHTASSLVRLRQHNSRGSGTQLVSEPGPEGPSSRLRKGCGDCGTVRATVHPTESQVLPDALMVVRCPYCMSGMDFAQMTAHKDGRFVCRDCAHTVRPGVPHYRCTCRNCLRLLDLSRDDSFAKQADDFFWMN